jgi:surface antigen
MKIILCLLLFLPLALASPLAQAQYAALLKGAVAERFDDEDLRMFVDAARKVLHGGAAENETVKWQNPKNRHGGEITLLRNFESQGRACKEVKVFNHAQGRKATNSFDLCQVDGKWRLLGSSQLKNAK